MKCNVFSLCRIQVRIFRKLSLFFNAVIRSKEAEHCKFIKRLILLYFYNRLPSLNLLICGGCSYLKVIAVFQPNHAYIWLIFRVCLFFYTPSYWLQLPSLIKILTFGFCVETQYFVSLFSMSGVKR